MMGEAWEGRRSLGGEHASAWVGEEEGAWAVEVERNGGDDSIVVSSIHTAPALSPGHCPPSSSLQKVQDWRIRDASVRSTPQKAVTKWLQLEALRWSTNLEPVIQSSANMNQMQLILIAIGTLRILLHV